MILLILPGLSLGFEKSLRRTAKPHMTPLEIKCSLDSLENALARLKAFISEPIVTDRDKAGVIQALELSFELAWKAIQKFAVRHSSH
jgi:hypothetical protein